VFNLLNIISLENRNLKNESGDGMKSMTMNVNGIIEKYRIIFRKVTSKSYFLYPLRNPLPDENAPGCSS